MNESLVGDLITSAWRRLAAAGIPSARLDAELLLGHVLGQERLKLVVYPERRVSVPEAARFESYIERRVRRESVAYIVGTKEFWGLEFEVSPAVLVPRPETEILVEAGLKLFGESRNSAPTILDLGTGSGCICVSIARSLKAEAAFIAVDESEAALAVARRNAARHGVSIDFRCGSWWQPLKDNERFDLIVSNPPYIPRGSTNIDPELATEPAGALYADDEGLSDILAILQGLPRFLKPGGWALLEIGAGQAAMLRERIPKAEFIKDLAGIERVLKVQQAG